MAPVDLLLAWPLPGARDLGAQLVASYAHPDRGYHDSRHLGEVLERVHELSAHQEQFDRMAVVLAAWFHDSVYDAQPDAEKRSAAWAAEALPTLVPPACVEEVVRLVLVTERHRPADDDANDARDVRGNGRVGSSSVDGTCGGVVPALWISL
mgnify:CR=1 FL=1